MKIKIDIATVRRIFVKLGERYFAAVVHVTDDGYTLKYAIKIDDRKNVVMFQVRWHDGWKDSPNNRVKKQVLKTFTEFLDLIMYQFQKTDVENRDKPKFKEGMTINQDKNAMLCVSKYDGIYDGKFIRVIDDSYYSKPFDMSEDWQSFEPSATQRNKINSFTNGTQRYLSKKTTAIKLQTRRNASAGIF